jgi:hypothetical protein
MKPHDVRIGNSVLDKDGNIKTVFAILSNGLVFDFNQYIGTPIEWCNPMPLTEEWLIKVGFIKLDSEGYFYIHEYNMGFKVSEDLKMVAWNNLHLDGVKIEYLHQLQNLFYAITNEELTIKNEH